MSSIGETSLQKLLSSLKLILSPEVYVFASLPHDAGIPTALPLQMVFREQEGMTIITTKTAAEKQELDYTFPCRMITLDVHSSLAAVGFIAVIASELKKLGMGVNPVSGYYHDHCFVPEGREEEAIECLEELAKKARDDLVDANT